MRTLCRRAIGRMNWCNGEILAEETRRSYGEECHSALPAHQMAGRVHVANSASGDFLDHRFVWSCSLVYGSLHLLLTGGGHRLA